MIIMNIKLKNFLIFDDFELCTSYPKKIIGSGIGEEHLDNKPNFRYKKLIVLMGANATGKTALGRILMAIFNFIYFKEYNKITHYIEDNSKDAFFAIDFVFDSSVLYRVTANFSAKLDGTGYESDDITVTVKSTDILANDNYERCADRLEKKDSIDYSNYIEALEKVPRLSWCFEFPYMPRIGYNVWSDNSETYHTVLKKTLKTLDPRIIDVVSVEGDKDVYTVVYPHFTVLVKKGEVVDKGILSTGTVEGIGIAVIIASMKTHRSEFYYCDEKFSHIHSEAEKAYLSLFIELLGKNEQMIVTTHNTDILDMNIPKHTFAFLRRDENNDNHISCVFASDYLKKNTDSLKNAVENDVFSSAPDISGIFELGDA